MTPAGAWRSALPRAAESTLAARISVLAVKEDRLVRDALPDLMTEHALLTLLEGPDGRFGLAIIEAPILSGLIEAAMTGRVNARPSPSREPTRTDATICADLIDSMLDGFESCLGEMEDPPNFAGYRFATPLHDARAVTMTLAEGPYAVFRLTVDLGGGLRQGEILVTFPVAPKGASRRSDVEAFQRALADNVMQSPTELSATLCRLQLPLAQVSGLRSGDVLRVPLAALTEVNVEAPGGPQVAQARLGQQGGFRAIRITHVKGVDGREAEIAEFEEVAPTAPHAMAEIGADTADGDFALGDLPELDGDLPPYDRDSELPGLQGEVLDPELADLSAEDGDFEDLPGLPPLSD